MELLQLRYFCDAAQTENFSQTARKYHVPTSSISQTIKRLEAELGVELFSRRKNHIFLNEQGRIFYQGAKAALDKLEDTRLQLRDTQETVSGKIRILALTNRRLITKAIECFKSSYPAVSFVLSHSRSAREDAFDIIVADDSFSSEKYEQQSLLSEDICLAVHRGHRLSDTEQVLLSDLRKERFISMSMGSSLHSITGQLCRSAGFEPEIAIETDDPLYMRKYIELGLGVAFVPARSWKGEISEKIVLKDLQPALRRNTHIFLPSDRYLTKPVTLFAQVLSKAAETY